MVHRPKQTEALFTKRRKTVHKLTDASQLFENEIGGKALRLAQLIRAGLRVKPGIILTADEVDGIAENESLTEMQHEELRVITTTTTVAVRSSAAGEDGATASWAGQFKTKLFVPAAGVVDAILECAAARNSEGVLAYATQHSLATGRLALVVQEMVDAAAAGVLFTTDPKDTELRQMVVEVVEGVGEGLVNGSQTPRRYRIREDGTVVTTEGAPLPELSQVQLDEIGAVGCKVRALFGNEQDIEWAIERGTGTLWLLQSRDITTLHQPGQNNVKLRRDKVIDDVSMATIEELERLAGLGLKVESDVWSDQNVAELLTPHPCQLAFDLFATVFAHNGAIRRGRNSMGYAIGAELNTGFFRLVGGQPRCSITHDACTYRIREFELTEYAQLVEYYQARIAEDNRLGNYPEVVLYDQNPPLSFLVELYGGKRGHELRAAYDRFFEGLRPIENTFDDTCRRQFLPHWHETICTLHNAPPMNEIAELTSRFAGLVKLLRTDACVAFVKGARLGFFAFTRLRNLLKKMFGEESEGFLNALTSGIPVGRNPNLRFNVALAKLRQDATFLREVSAQYGHLALHELEISVPRHTDNPALLVQLAEQMRGNPLSELKDSEQRSREVTAKVLVRAGTLAEELKREIHLARTYLSLREMLKFEYLKAYQLIRHTLCNLEQILRWEKDLIFHLTCDEVTSLNTESERLKQRARERQEEREINRSLFVPGVFDSKHLEDIGNPRVSGDGRFLYGIGATTEVTEGEAVVMHHFNDRDALSKLKPGTIMVTTTTDPAWSPLLALVGKTGGLVTEVGGLLSHGAIYAREMGFAAVLNVPQATTMIRTGMRIRVHGAGGYVEIIEDRRR
ncbi:MAG: hypothetical protein HY980_03860 [Candidatus Magasanikbacteria bacterium]|nr:hypothetical protein [Candidatus Magasanikbacteria bacterium]